MFLAYFTPRRALLTLTALMVMGATGIASPRAASAQAITDLFNTAVDAGGNVLMQGDMDPHYTQNSGNSDAPYTFVYDLPGTYAANPNATSNYVTIDQSGGGGAYTVNIQTTFTLPNNTDLSAVSIIGNWSTDNLGNDILINGVSTGITSPGFSGFTSFVLPTGSYVVGTNTLDFILENQGGPGALNVYFDSAIIGSTSPTAVPEPGSIALFVGLGVAGAGSLFRARRRK